ncbi:MAG TPA: hypothetical protein VHF58_05570 [Solirubrobacterales bacterium]|nr:hypothetical protein [Solirubrobacterales bacterium]
MSLAAIAAWAMLALLIGWLGIVLAATFHQMGGEIEEDARRRDR